MTKKDLIIAVSDKTGITQTDVTQVIIPLFECMFEALIKGENITINNFGCFYIKQRKERKARNPSTGESFIAPPKKVIKFKITPKFKLE
jgi:nucleoid DNA-binding protein